MSQGVWDNWFLMALLNPVAWAIGCLLDVFLIDRKIYRKPIEPIVVSGLFFYIPLVFTLCSSSLSAVETVGLGPDQLLSIPDQAVSTTVYKHESFSDVMVPETLQHTPLESSNAFSPTGVLFAVLAALLLIMHLYFYYKVLFVINDVCKLEAFNLLSVVLVPVMSILLFGERLAAIQYAAIVVATLGVSVLIHSHRGSERGKVVVYSSVSVLTVSLSMICLVQAHDQSQSDTVMAWYFLTFVIGGIVPLLVNMRLRIRVLVLLRVFIVLFFATEIIQIAALVASQRAIDLQGSASMVALVECALPLFVILFSAASLLIVRTFYKTRIGISNVLALQVAEIKDKSLSMLLIGLSIVITQI